MKLPQAAAAGGVAIVRPPFSARRAIAENLFLTAARGYRKVDHTPTESAFGNAFGG